MEQDEDDDDYGEQSDNDNDINTNTNSDNKKNKSSSSISVTLSKIKEASLKDACKYDVVDDCGFKCDQQVEYIIIASLFDKLAATTKRLAKIESMSRLFRSILHLRSSELLYCVYLCCNAIAPPYAGIELGIDDGIILKALCESTGR
eukprot:UN04594